MRLSRPLLVAVVCASSFGAQTLAATDTNTATATKQSKAPLAHVKPAPITPPEPAAINDAIQRGVKFLLADQRPDGSWGSPEKTKGLNIYAPPPGAHDAFRTAVTSLVVMALIEAEPQVAESTRPAVAKAIDRGAAWLDKHLSELRRATPDALYNVWGHAYSIEALVKLRARAAGNVDLQKKWKDHAQAQADLLARYSYVGGGWSYYDMMSGSQTPGDAAFSFCTAAVLIALKQAESIEVTFPERLTKKAIASILRQRRPDFSYNYGEYTRLDPRYHERPGGSLGRSQACNLALRLYGDEKITDEVLKSWLDRLYARNGWLSMGRKRPVPHESYFGVAGYYYYYGHWYAARCIQQLPENERPYFQDHLAHILLPLQERDGSWWDYPFYNYHQQYGTAMAVMTLLGCQHP
ncbi:MAG: terpene cyclase/mutase family protein [Planctomycetes bacterium]|nr:terpene cyclase/mutase family protein [Planctomycetota bacterium]